MDKIKLRPGALAQLLKSRNMSWSDAAKDPERGTPVVDRKTLAKMDRGEEVKREMFQNLATRLGLPITYFDSPADNSVDQDVSQSDDTRWLNLILRSVDAERLAGMLSDTEKIRWQLNVRAVDDETIQFLEQLEDAVNTLHSHLTGFSGDEDDYGTLKFELAGLKKTMHVASMVEELTKRHLAVLGAEYLYWETLERTTYDEDGNEYNEIKYVSSRHLVLSIEAQPGQARRAKVWQGTIPPKAAPDPFHIITVNGTRLDIVGEIPF